MNFEFVDICIKICLHSLITFFDLAKVFNLKICLQFLITFFDFAKCFNLHENSNFSDLVISYCYVLGVISYCIYYLFNI